MASRPDPAQVVIPAEYVDEWDNLYRATRSDTPAPCEGCNAPTTVRVLNLTVGGSYPENFCRMCLAAGMDNGTLDLA